MSSLCNKDPYHEMGKVLQCPGSYQTLGNISLRCQERVRRAVQGMLCSACTHRERIWKGLIPTKFTLNVSYVKIKRTKIFPLELVLYILATSEEKLVAEDAKPTDFIATH